MGLRGALKDVGTKVKDLMSLEVETYTGSFTALLKPDDTGTPTDQDGFINFKKNVKEGKVEIDGTFRLALYTHISADGDALLFRDTDISTAALVEAHDAAVKAGIETRASIFALFKDLID